jgi:hypothetical protein
MLAYPPLFIRIARKGHSPQHDDTIVIKPLDGNVHVKHTDGSQNDKIVTEAVLTNTGLVGYISTLAAMVRDDTDPFNMIQFSFPGFPMVAYTPARLHNPAVMRTLKDAARITSDSWFRHDPGYDADASSDVSSDSDSSSSASSEETWPY